jgi:hypothetical protein
MPRMKATSVPWQYLLCLSTSYDETDAAKKSRRQ